MALPLICGKENFWVELNDLGNLSEGAWCIGGELNEVLYSEDQKGRRRSNAHRMNFHEWVNEFGLIDLPIHNIQFT